LLLWANLDTQYFAKPPSPFARAVFIAPNEVLQGQMDIRSKESQIQATPRSAELDQRWMLRETQHWNAGQGNALFTLVSKNNKETH
jgi:hypothetical protein